MALKYFAILVTTSHFPPVSRRRARSLCGRGSFCRPDPHAPASLTRHYRVVWVSLYFFGARNSNHLKIHKNYATIIIVAGAVVLIWVEAGQNQPFVRPSAKCPRRDRRGG